MNKINKQIVIKPVKIDDIGSFSARHSANKFLLENTLKKKLKHVDTIDEKEKNSSINQTNNTIKLFSTNTEDKGVSFLRNFICEIPNRANEPVKINKKITNNVKIPAVQVKSQEKHITKTSSLTKAEISTRAKSYVKSGHHSTPKNISYDNAMNTPKSPTMATAFLTAPNSSTPVVGTTGGLNANSARFSNTLDKFRQKDFLSTKFSEKNFSSKKIDVSNLYFASSYLKTSPNYKNAINKIFFQKSDTKYIKFLDQDKDSRNKNRSRSILKSSIIEKSMSSLKKNENLGREDSTPDIQLVSAKSSHESKIVLSKTKYANTFASSNILNSNYVKSKKNMESNINLAKNIKYIVMIKLWKGFSKRQNFLRKRKNLANAFVFSRKAYEGNLTKIVSHLHNSNNFFNMDNFKSTAIQIFGEKQISQFIPFFMKFWKKDNEEFTKLLKLICESISIQNSTIQKNYDNIKNCIGVIQNFKNKFKGSDLKNIEHMIKNKLLILNSLNVFYERIVKTQLMIVKSASLRYFDMFLNKFSNFYDNPEETKHEINFVLNENNEINTKLVNQLYIKKITESLKDILSEYLNKTPLVSFKEKVCNILSNSNLKRSIVLFAKILDFKQIQKNYFSEKTQNITKLVDENLNESNLKIVPIVSSFEKEFKKLIEFRNSISTINQESFDFGNYESFLEGYLDIEAFSTNLNDKYEINEFVFDFTDVKFEIVKLKEKLSSNFNDKFNKVIINTIKVTKEKIKVLGNTYEKLNNSKQTINKQILSLVETCTELSLIKKKAYLVNSVTKFLNSKNIAFEGKQDQIEINNNVEIISKKLGSIIEGLVSQFTLNYANDDISGLKTKILNANSKLNSVYEACLQEENFTNFKINSQEVSEIISNIRTEITLGYKKAFLFTQNPDFNKFPENLIVNDTINFSTLKFFEFSETCKAPRYYIDELNKISKSFNELVILLNFLIGKLEKIQNIVKSLDFINNSNYNEVSFQNIYSVFIKINDYFSSDFALNEIEKYSFIALLTKRTIPIIKFCYFKRFGADYNLIQSPKLVKIKDFEQFSNENILMNIFTNSDVNLEISNKFNSFRNEIIKNVNDVTNIDELNKFIKRVEENYLDYKIDFNSYFKNSFARFNFSNLENQWKTSFETFESAILVISHFCDLHSTFVMKSNLISKIIEITEKFEENTNINEVINNIQNIQDEAIIFIIKTSLNLFLSSLEEKIIDNIKNLLNEKINCFNKILLIEKDFILKIKQKYPKLLILEDNDIIKFNWLLINPIKSNFESINMYYYKLTNTTLHFEEITDDENSSEHLITGVIGRGNDYLKFRNFIQFSNDIPGMLLEIEAEIEYSLKYNLIESLNNFSKMDFEVWINSCNFQVIVNDLYLIFTNDISQILISDTKEEENKSDDSNSDVRHSIKNHSDNLHKLSNVSSNDKLNKFMKKIDQTNLIKKTEVELKEKFGKFNDWIEKTVTILKSNDQEMNLKYYTIQNILTTLINQKDIIEFLLKNNVYDSNSYEWLKNIRHIWDSQSKEVVIECGGWSIFQHYNYIGNFERLFLTPQTDKIYLFFASCFREKSTTIIKTNITQDGYYSIFEEFANYLWIQIRKVYLSEGSLYKKMTTLFDVCTMTNNWIFLENLSELKDQSIIYVSKMMQMIQQEIILDEIKTVDNSNMKDMKKMFCVVGCLKISQNAKVIDNFLKSSCRIMSIITPDINVFSKGIIKFFARNSNEEKQFDSVVNVLQNFQNLIRTKYPSFYFNFHVLNVMKNFLLNKVVINNVFSLNLNFILKSVMNYVLEFSSDMLISLDIKLEDIKGFFNKNSQSNLFDYIKSDLNSFFEEKINCKNLLNISNSDLISNENNNRKLYYFYNSLNNINRIPLVYGEYGSGKSKTIDYIVNQYVKINNKNVKVIFLKEVMFMSEKNLINEFFNLIYENEYENYEMIMLILENYENNDNLNMMLSVYNDFFSIKNLQKFRMIIEKTNMKNIDHSIFSICNLVYIEQVNWKKLQKSYLNNIKSNLKSMNILINDEFYLSILEFTKNTLVYFYCNLSDKYLYYKIILLYNFIDLYLKRIYSKKVTSIPKNFLFNIFIQSLIVLCCDNSRNSKTIEIIKYLQNSCKTYFKSEISNEFLNEYKAENDYYLDFETISFKKLDSFINLASLNSDLLLYGKKEFTCFYLLELSYISKSPFLIIGNNNYTEGILMKNFTNKQKIKPYCYTESAQIEDFNNLKNKENVIYIDDVNVDQENSNIVKLFDFYYKENQTTFADINKKSDTELRNLFIFGESSNNEQQIQNCLLYKVNRYTTKPEEEIFTIFKKITHSVIKNKKYNNVSLDLHENFMEILKISLQKFENNFSKVIDNGHFHCLKTFFYNFEKVKMQDSNEKDKFMKFLQSLYFTSFNTIFKGSNQEPNFKSFLYELSENESFVKNNPEISEKPQKIFKNEHLNHFFSRVINSSSSHSKSFITLICDKFYLKSLIEHYSTKLNFVEITTVSKEKFCENILKYISEKNKNLILRIKLTSIESELRQIFKLIFMINNHKEVPKLGFLGIEDSNLKKILSLFHKNDQNFKFIFVFETYLQFNDFATEFPNFIRNNLNLEIENNNEIFQTILTKKFEKSEQVDLNKVINFFDSLDLNFYKKLYEKSLIQLYDNKFDQLNFNKLFKSKNSFYDFCLHNKHKSMYFFNKFIDYYFENLSFNSIKTLPLTQNIKSGTESHSNLEDLTIGLNKFKDSIETSVKNDQEKDNFPAKSKLSLEDKKNQIFQLIDEIESLFKQLNDQEYSKNLQEIIETKDLKVFNEFLTHLVFSEKNINTLNLKIIIQNKFTFLSVLKVLPHLKFSKQQIFQIKEKLKKEQISFSQFFGRSSSASNNNLIKLLFNLFKICYNSLSGDDSQSIFLSNYNNISQLEKGKRKENFIEKIENCFEINEKNVKSNQLENFSNCLTIPYQNMIGDCLIISILLIFERRFSIDYLKLVTQNLATLLESKGINYTEEWLNNPLGVMSFYQKYSKLESNEPENEEGNVKIIRQIYLSLKNIKEEKQEAKPINGIDNFKLENIKIFKFFKSTNFMLKTLALHICEKDKFKDFENDLINSISQEKLKPFVFESNNFLSVCPEKQKNSSWVFEQALKRIKKVNNLSKINKYFSNIEKNITFLEINCFIESIKLYKRLTNEAVNKPYFLINDFFNLYWNDKSLQEKGITIEYLAKKIYENIFFNVSNKFLLTILITFELLKIKEEITSQEHTFLICMIEANLKVNKYRCVQSLKHLNNDVLPFIKTLLAHYKSIDNPNNQELIIILDLIIRGYDIYVIRNKIDGIKKKSKKILFLAIFQEEDFFSDLKYLINKNLNEKYLVEKNRLNDFLNKKKYKCPILVKTEVSVNITNFLCSLASYYETEFIIIRNLENIENSTFLKYNYIVDNDYKSTISHCFLNGGWLLVSCGVDLSKIIKLYNFYLSQGKQHDNFRLFIDNNLVESSKECRRFLSYFTQIIYIDSICVDELEAAHDVWVNILEEKLISDTMIDDSITENENQKNHNINDFSSISNFQFQVENNGNYNKEGKSYLSDVKDFKILHDVLEKKNTDI